MSKSVSFLRSVSIGDLTAVRRLLDAAKNTSDSGDEDSSEKSAAEKKKVLETYFSEHDEKGKTAIHISAALDSTEICQELINAGANVNVQDYFLNTPIYDAVLNKQFETVKLLVSCHAVLETENSIGETVIHAAAKAKDLEILRYLCEQGVDPNHTTQQGQSAVGYAVKLVWLEGIKALVSYGAKLQLSTPGSVHVMTVLIKKIIKKDLFNDENALELLKYLIANKIDVETPFKNARGQTLSPLLCALRPGRLQFFQVLLTANPSMNQELPNGELPLQAAIRQRLTDFVQPIIDAKANIMQLFPNNRSYLHIAAGTDGMDLELFTILMNNYAARGPDYKEAVEDNLRWIEAEKENMKSDNRLYDRNGRERPVVLRPVADRYKVPRLVDPFFVDNDGNTPLILAAKANSIDIVEYLIQYGCDPSYENKRRHTAYTVTTAENAERIVEIVSQEGFQETFENMKIIDPYHSKFDAKKDETRKSETQKTKKAVQLTLTQKTALLDEKKSQSPPASPIARPWGGSYEADEFRRKTRVNLRNLRNDMLTKAQELKESILQIYQEFEIEPKP